MFAEKSDGKCLFQGLEPKKTYSSHHSAPRILNLSDCGKPTKKRQKIQKDKIWNSIFSSFSRFPQQTNKFSQQKPQKKKKRKKEEEFTLTIADDSRLLGGG